MKSKKSETSLIADLKREYATFRSLKGRDRLVFIYDYYRWKILAGIFILAVLFSVCDMVWEGHKNYDLHVCAVLDHDTDCSEWFAEYSALQKTDGRTFRLDLNQDQPFDYGNPNFQVYEVEVLTKISSHLMDVAICNADLYSYLLAINACLPLDTVLPASLADSLKEEGSLTEATANLQMDKYGKVDESQGIPGFYAIHLTSGSFSDRFYRDQQGPMYAVIISNTEHTEQSIRLLEALCS